MKISPPPSPPPSVDIDGVPLRDGKKIDLKHLLGHMPDVADDEEEEARSLAALAGPDKDPASAAQLIETQFQPVDDDDLVFGEEGDDDDELNGEGRHLAAADEPTQRKRRSSLKRCMHEHDSGSQVPPDLLTTHHESPSPDHSQKAVRFADAVGLGLADVRDLVNADEPPTIPPSALRDLHVRRRKRSKSHLTYSLDFSQPGSDPTFITRVLADKVSASHYLLLSLHSS